ncbi:hydantoinase/oxoprolinase family protein (plasmid) [Ensifer adhaerens]|uniref:hydantoinase/oxoprolinase family protein n=1 Tax=Ensifer adhaerens TaxID=106592 RepID=UPI001CBE89CD|nr:hydantoinase/oxoprolinase family protein [Ensifer adhaerens]MBZ7927361.1 hydantoinase/oxoprolinase family protein [Ensifer adhaerens]UAX98368.1 hydantoinase/oxoprolinase family protein [Ensifer adhaerens]UAY05751.1 hydantoinase/oxoprolinase family protein [Ensifer adhaerens]UAY13129.1 hydantoinase/oxoprolinase family protein [Ensifer adhaerens]
MGGYRVTVDTGGTFSDFVYLDETTGETSISKVPSTPDDPSRAILSGIDILLSRGVQPDDVNYFCHGTTVGTNALLEGKGAKTGLLVTKGFRGIYEVGEQARPHGSAIFDILYEKPAPIVLPSLTGEVVERVVHDGSVLESLDEAALRETLGELRGQDVESVAVCLLFSFLHPGHEERIREIVREELPDCEVSLSCEIVPQIREYHRLSTTVINAYLQPVLARYIARLADRLEEAGVKTPQKYIMQSNGGMATFEATAKKGVSTVLSGPAGGVTASVAMARSSGHGDIVTFDMGGTSCDVALIKNGTAVIANRGKVEGRDIAIPMMDINTVSAGGGTIAEVDRFGVLQVGPESAGAIPGPACYSRGGTKPTITDCNLLLGYLSEENFLGGKMRLDARKARQAVETHVAGPLGMDALEAAEGVIRIINVKMEEAIKAISTTRGHDLRDFMLLPFGGAGPLHAGRMVRELGMAGFIVPLHAGVFSAMGLVMSDVTHDYVRSRLIPLDGSACGELAAIFAGMEAQALADLAEEGFPADRIRLQRALDLRYAGQGYELVVPLGGIGDGEDLARVREAFDAEHEAMFGHKAAQEAVEIVSYRVKAVGLLPPVHARRYQPNGGTLADACLGQRSVRFDGECLDCSVYQRERLDVGLAFTGPAVVEQFDCTTVILPGQQVRVDEFKNLIVTEVA